MKEEKKEMAFVDYELNTDYEYSLEELTKQCNDIFNECKNQFLEDSKKQGYYITRFTIFSYYQNGYYGDCNGIFQIKVYRTESDKEFETRINREKEYLKHKKLTEDAKKAREFTRELQKKKLMEDPDYKKFLKLKEKFGGR